MKIYALSGLGANEKVYEKIQLPSTFEWHFISWIQPLDNESLHSYAQRLSEKIECEEEFILMGLSFGGIVAQEIAKWKAPKKLILFSTVKNPEELPIWIRIHKRIKLHRILPVRLLSNDFLIQSISQILSIWNPARPNLSIIFTYRNPFYLNWAISQVVHWKKNDITEEYPVFHVHGTKDFIFPIRNIVYPIKVNGGGHVIVYEKANEVSKILQQIL